MRSYALIATLCALLFAAFALADPVPRQQPPTRAIAFGKPDAAVRERSGGGGAAKESTVNYLVTLERSITNSAKDKILDVLLRSGAVVKEEYNYRVYKGILFSIPVDSDKGLMSWQSSLVKQDGVKYVEEDQVVKTQ
ncbi:hypothetical protein JCM10213_003143 [Rhodosporidiobolus nylandii]